MEKKQSIRLSPQLIIGLLVVFLGVVFLLGNMDMVDPDSILRFWPIAVILLGLSMIVTAGELAGRVTGLLVALAGCLILANTLGYAPFHFWDFWPLVLILVGGNLVWQALNYKVEVKDSNSTIFGIGILGGFNKTCNCPDFRGGELTGFMGGGEVDLRHASIEEEQAVINCYALMGGFKIRVPMDWNVNCKVLPIMGGVDEKTTPPGPGAGKTLLLRGFAIMGGIEICN